MFTELHSVFVNEIQHSSHCPKLGLHVGNASLQSLGNPNDPMQGFFARWKKLNGQDSSELRDQEFQAGCVVPASGPCVIFLACPREMPLSRNFGTGLAIRGHSAEGAFILDCPEFYVHDVSKSTEIPGWAILQPVNQTMKISYGSSCNFTKVRATLNNFDYEYGNVPDDFSHANKNQILRVKAGDRDVDFVRRSEYAQLRRMLDGGMLTSTSLVEICFHARPGEAEEELLTFAFQVSGMCNLVAMQHTGPNVVSLFDSEDQVTKRLVGNPVESEFRRSSILGSLHIELPQFFCECFSNFIGLNNNSSWGAFNTLIASLEDPPYLEQKLMSLFAAVEGFVKFSLLEDGMLEKDLPTDLNTCIGAAKSRLGWDVPKHYKVNNKIRPMRNGLMHEFKLNSSPADSVMVFQKWRVFLMRRLLHRLGYTGRIDSASAGVRVASEIGDFSEEANSFS